MADAADLKSVVRKDVRVRLPPSAPLESHRLGLGRRYDLSVSSVCLQFSPEFAVLEYYYCKDIKEIIKGKRSYVQ